MPTNISIHTAGVGELFVGSQYLQLTSSAGITYGSVYQDTSDDANSRLWAVVESPFYSVLWTNTLVNVSFVTWSGPTAPFFPGFMFASQSLPVISSISGCTGSGLSTTDCIPDGSVLTIQGTGMGWLESMHLRIGLGQMDLDLTSLQTVNDTYATLSLTTLYYRLLLPEHYNAVLLPLWFESRSLLPNGTAIVEATNTVSISFVPLPAPILRSARSYYCDAVSSGLANFTNRTPGLQIVLSGHYMYNLSATIGGVPCVNGYSAADSYSFHPPVGAGLQPNVAYSLVASNGQGSIELSSFIAFTAKPTIAYIVSCTAQRSTAFSPIEYGDSSSLCKPGTSITIKGSQCPLNDSTLEVDLRVTQASGIPSFHLSCPNATAVDDSTVTCALPLVANATLAAIAYRRYVSVQVGFSSSSVWTNSIVYQLYQDPLAPVISGLSASGCGSTTTSISYPGSPLQVSDCASNATLTLTGTYFDASYYIVSGVTTPFLYQQQQAAAVVLSNSSTQIVLQLPDMNNVPSPILTNTPYQYQLTMVNGATYFQTNIFLVTFAAPPPISPPSSSSSSGLSHGAIAGIVVAAVVVAAVCSVLVVLLLRRASSSSSSSSSSGRSTAAGGDDGLKWSEKPTRLRDESRNGSDAMRGVELH